MHLVRLFMTSVDMLECGEIRVHRPEEDLVLLGSIRNGNYMENGVLVPVVSFTLVAHLTITKIGLESTQEIEAIYLFQH